MKKYTSLSAILRDADERVKKAAVDALNKASDDVQTAIKANMDSVGIKENTGMLRGSIEVEKATEKRLKTVIKSEVFKPAPLRPGSRNPRMKGRYKHGAPYGRIIEFSPRINKPFFYTAWYRERKRVKDEIITAIGEAWR